MVKKFRPVFTNEAIVLAAALLITLPLRTLQHLTNMEQGTGFYTKIDWNIIVYGIVLTAAMGYFIFSAVKKRKKVLLETAPVKLPGCGVLSFLAAFAVAYGAYYDYKLSKVDVSLYTVSSTATSAINGSLLNIQFVVGAVAAVFFLILSVLFLAGKASSTVKLLSLTPVLWFILKLVVRFTRTVSYIRVSDLAMEMISLVLLALFFMAFAQTNSNIEAEGTAWKLEGFGFPAALMCLNMFVPRIVIALAGKAEFKYILSYADFSDFALALFIVATVLTRIIPNTANIIVTPSAEVETAE